MRQKLLSWLAVLCLLLSACGNSAASWQEQYDLGVKYLSEGNYEEAILAFEAAIEIDPRQPELYLGLADCYLDLHETALARDTLLRGIEETDSPELIARLRELGWYTPSEQETIIWHDAAMEAMISQALDTADQPLTVQDLSGIRSLTILGKTHVYLNEESGHSWTSPENGVHYYTVDGVDYTEQGSLSSLEDLMWFPDLEKLTIDANHISDLTPLAGCRNLKELSLNRNDIADISPLAALPGLEKLSLRYNAVEDISMVGRMTSLTYLGLSENKIRSAEPLSALVRLENLNLWNNQIQDISPLAPLTNLTRLRISSNQVRDISALANMQKLTYLSIADNQIQDISALRRLVQLQTLHAAGNQITDWSAVEGIPGITITGRDEQLGPT